MNRRDIPHEQLLVSKDPSRLRATTQVELQFHGLRYDAERWSYGSFQLGGQFVSLVRTSAPCVGDDWRPVSLPSNGILHGIVLLKHDDTFGQGDAVPRYFDVHLARYGKLLGVKSGNTFGVWDGLSDIRCRYLQFDLQMERPGDFHQLMMRGIGPCRDGFGFVVPSETQTLAYDILMDVAGLGE